MKPDFYELDLSDEHMAHVYRFRRLGKFDRQRWKILRDWMCVAPSYCAWMKSRFTPGPAASAATDQKRAKPTGVPSSAESRFVSPFFSLASISGTLMPR